jgi:hypothetical protein
VSSALQKGHFIIKNLEKVGCFYLLSKYFILKINHAD